MVNFTEFVNRNKNVIHTIKANRITNAIAVSEERDAFYRGELFKKYEFVESNGIVYKILEQCSNYYQVVDSTGNVSRKFARQLSKSKSINTDVVGAFHGYVVESEAGKELLKQANLNECDDVGLLKQLKETDQKAIMEDYKNKDKMTVAKIIADAVGVPHDLVSDPTNLVNSAIRKAKKDPVLMKNKAILQNMLQIAKEVGIKYSETAFDVNEATEHWTPTGKVGTHVKTGEKTKEYAHYKDGNASGKRHWRTADGKIIEEAVSKFEINELSIETLKSYSHGAKKDANKLIGTAAKMKSVDKAHEKLDKAGSRMDNAVKADKKVFKKEWNAKVGIKD